MLFFFSSRRRHTRCGRDWSSDVCSSDLDDLWGRGCRHVDPTVEQPAMAAAVAIVGEGCAVAAPYDYCFILAHVVRPHATQEPDATTCPTLMNSTTQTRTVERALWAPYCTMQR